MKKKNVITPKLTRKRPSIVIIALALLCLLITPGDILAQVDKGTNGYVTANGVNYYYEIHGQGEPLLLLHGGLGSGEMFNPILPMLTKSHEVIVLDLHGHGRTALGDRKFSIVDMGDDMATILKKLGYEKVDVLGYSMGSNVALQFAIQHPDLINKLVLVACVFARKGYYSGVLKRQKATLKAEFAKMMKGTTIYKTYKKLAPHPEDFPKLLEQVGNWMTQPYNWSAGVKKLEMPIMLIYPDGGMIRLEHIVKFYHMLGGGLRDPGWNRKYMPQNRLAILPNLTHYDIFLSPEMVETALTFLEGSRSSKNWKKYLNKSES